MSIAVLGIGNVLLSDDGVGVHVIRHLQEAYSFPDSVQLIDGGTKGLDLLPYFEALERILIVDAANFGKAPGTIDLVEGEKIPAFLSTKLSVHQIGLPDTLFAAKLMNITPSEMTLVGIQPKSMETGTELSPEIQDRIPHLVTEVLKKLKDWGVEAEPRR